VTTQHICWSHRPRALCSGRTWQRDTEVYRDILCSFVNTFGCNVESHLKGFQKYWNTNLYRPKTKYFAIQCSQLPKVSLCFWKELYGALVEWNWEGKLKCWQRNWSAGRETEVLAEKLKCWQRNWSAGRETEVLAEKPVPVALWPPHNWYGLRCDRTRTLSVTGLRLAAWAVKTEINQNYI